jgi:hypothetical protein
MTSFFKLTALIFLYLCSFLFIQAIVTQLGKLYQSSYYNSSLSWSILTQYQSIPLVFLLIVAGVFVVGRVIENPYSERLFTSWETLQEGRKIRIFVCFLALIVVWPAITLGYNFYFDQGYVIDRLVIAVLFLMLCWRPIFIYPLLTMLLAMFMQMKMPHLGGTILAHKLQVLNALFVFSGAFTIYLVSGYRKTSIYVFLTCCLVAGAYWLPALTKLQLGWFGHGQLVHVPLAAYAHGWLNFLDNNEIVKLASSMVVLDLPMKIFVIVVEAGCLFFMLSRRISSLLLTCVIVFHLAVFAIYGFLFWTWILLDVALLVMLLKDRKNSVWEIYDKRYLLLSVILIGFCQYWAKPPALGWFDTRVSYTYKIEAINEFDERYRLPPTYFSPYGDNFTMQSFAYLSKEQGTLVGPYGVTKSHQIAGVLEPILTAEEFFKLEKLYSTETYKQSNADVFYKFLANYVSNHNRKVNQPPFKWQSIAPPRQFWGLDSQIANQSQKRIKKIIVSQVTTLYDGSSLKVIREKELKTLDIPIGDEP